MNPVPPTSSPAQAAPSLAITCSRDALPWLHEQRISLVLTTYQTNRLFFLGLKPNGQLAGFERLFDRPLGLYATPERLLMATRYQIWQLDNALTPGSTYRGYDRLYVPRVGFTTGEVDTHDVAVDRDGRVVFVNTLYSCLATLSEQHSFEAIWQPPFISKLAPEDRCHLNGMAIEDGVPRFVSAVSRSDVTAGWRERRQDGGCIVDVPSNEIVLTGLSMPHSPRVYQGKLWVLNSGAGEFGYVDVEQGRFVPVAFCPGYLRGLAFHGNYAIVGLSKPRGDRVFTGLALDERLTSKEAAAQCGLMVVDLSTGNIVHWIQLEGVVVELYDVQVLTGIRQPMALGFRTDEIRRVITFEAGGSVTMHALSTQGGKPRR